MTEAFNYQEFTQRNIGFVTEAQQAQLRGAHVLILGVGGMGGACLQALARAGVGGFGLADFDTFEVSNLNRQVFANLDAVGVEKVAATVAALARINPELEIETFGAEWVHKLDVLLPRYKIVVNGMDDLIAGIELYRKAKVHGVTVIDAYTAPLPSVTVVGSRAPRPEERLGFPTQGVAFSEITASLKQECLTREIEYVLVNSSSLRHVDLEVAKELMNGRRKRMSFAPMVITTGNMMAFECVKLILGLPQLADERGYFFNPWRMKVERPRNPLVAWAMLLFVRRFIARLLNA